MSRGKKRSVKVLVLPHAKGLPLPAYQTPDAAGLDLVAALPSDEPLVMKRGAMARVPTGLVLELPRGLEAQIRPRSGLAAKHGVTVLNSPGTIDSDYRGEIQVLLINHGREPYIVRRGERVAQMVIAPVEQVALKAVVDVGATVRGAGGFGSTGTGAAGATANTSGSKTRTTRAARKASRAGTGTLRGRRSAAEPRGQRR